MGNIIGVDLGGTNIEAGTILDGQVLKSYKVGTQAAVGGKRTMDLLKKVISDLMTDETEAIGIGVPSVVDRKNGIVYNVQNIAGWDEVHLKSILETEFGVPVHIDNDANCFAYGEKIYGKGKDLSDFVGVTLGTGVGAGIIKNGRLIPDANCGSGEFGEIPYMGSRLEDYCGSRFFTASSFGSGYDMAVSARNGDVEALHLFEEYGKHLAWLVKIIVLVLDPQAIIFGGSISKSFDLFSEAIHASLDGFPYPKSIENLKILVTGQTGSGILGAGSLCFTPAGNQD